MLFGARRSEQLGLLGLKLRQYSQLGPREYSKKVLFSVLHGFAGHLQLHPNRSCMLASCARANLRQHSH